MQCNFPLLLTFQESLHFQAKQLLLSGCHKKKQGSNRTVKITGNLMKKNFIINTATRLMRTNGIIVNILVRVFSFVMAVITVLCGIGIVTSYGNYKEQSSTPDCVNYMVDNVSSIPSICFKLLIISSLAELYIPLFPDLNPEK